VIKAIKEEKLGLLDHAHSIASAQALYGTREGFAVLEGEWFENSSVLFLDPVLRIEAHSSDPFAELRHDLIARLKYSALPTIPIAAGYLSYELAHAIEKFPASEVDYFSLPVYQFYLYGTIIILPKGAAREARLFKIEYLEHPPIWQAEQLPIEREPSATPSGVLKSSFEDERRSLEEALSSHSNFSRADYIEAIATIREGIRLGNVYQVNLSQRFSLPCSESAASLCKRVSSFSPARYAAFLSLVHPEACTMLSNSPELFFASDGSTLISSPIKGTRPRALDTKLDERARHELENSEKDRAELAMIVDLIRNDMGKVAKLGSVEVLKHCRVDSLSYVHHLVSDISCILKADVDLVDVIKALFPCGSITGAPKIAAMQQISKLERTTRGVYTGAIGFIGTNGLAKFNVAIRTALRRRDEIIFQTGGGIVYDSDPQLEYEETLAKALPWYLAVRAQE